MADEPDDSALLRAHLAGDPMAFTALVRRHEAWMWTTARAMLGNRDDAMEAVQLAFIRAFRSAHTWRGDGPLSSWLYRIMSRVVFDLYASRSRIPTPVETYDPSFEELIAPDNTESAIAECLLHEVVAALPPDQRECFVRTDLLGFTFAEVAADLGIPEGTVKSRRARGKARLVEALRTAGLVGPSRGQRASGPSAQDDVNGDCHTQ